MKKILLLVQYCILVIGLLTFTSCDPERNFEAGEDARIAATKIHYGVSVNTVYCLKDLLNGNPSDGGCWELVSDPSGTITQAQLDAGGDNVCIDFEGLQCPADYVFQYSINCDCPQCKKSATLTICLVCECGTPIVASISCSN
jgi:hypothetical protein